MATLVCYPRRACARVTVVVVSVCLSVYPSVPALAASASVETSKQRYSRVSLRLFLDFDSWISKKPSVKKLWREKANMQMSWSSTSAVFAYFRDQRTAGTTTSRSNIASDASYCRIRRVTSEIAARKNSTVLCIWLY